MSGPEVAIFGCLTPDNVVTADGECLPQAFGGNALYGALGAKVWSDRVGMVSRFGAGYPLACFELLRSLNVDIGGVRDLGKPHGRNVAFAYKADGSRTRAFPQEIIDRIPHAERARFIDSSTLPDALERWHEFAPDDSDVPAGWWQTLRGIHCATMPVGKHRRIARACRARFGSSGWIQIDSPFYDADAPPGDRDQGLYNDINALLPSEADLETFWPGGDPDETVITLLDRGARAAVLKLGSAGCRIFERGRGLTAEIPVVPVEARDPTGAGDSFCGGFLVGMLKTGHLIDAARYGTVSASFAVETRGLDGLVRSTRQDALDRLNSLMR
jgi:sugar/nucleoside kinase (ribokinase family)